MFAVIYRWRIVPGGEAVFLDAWEQATHRLRDERGALGSRLHRDGEGRFVAYAQWPDRPTWEASRAAGPVDPGLAARLESVVAERDEPMPLELERDLLETRGWTWD